MFALLIRKHRNQKETDSYSKSKIMLWGFFVLLFSFTLNCGLLYFTSLRLAVLMVGKNKSSYGGVMRWALSQPVTVTEERAWASECQTASCSPLPSSSGFSAAIKMTAVIRGDAAGCRLLFYGKFITDLRVLYEGQHCFSIDSRIKRILQIDYWIEMLHVVRTWRITSE